MPGPSKVEDMIQRRLEEKSWSIERGWGARMSWPDG
jgi:hypothetical protein